MQEKHILLVEGSSDQKFFKQLLKDLELKTEIEPKVPRDIEAKIFRNGLQPLYQQLKLQIDLLLRGQITRLGVVVDADYAEQELNGFVNRRRQLVSILADKGFTITEQPESEQGEIFHHSSGAKLGLWIMPDHRHDGMIEDLLLSCIKTDLNPLKEHAQLVVEQLGALQQFADHRTCKAYLATWLAWQDEPGISHAYAYYQDRFDKLNPSLVVLKSWLKSLFS